MPIQYSGLGVRLIESQQDLEEIEEDEELSSNDVEIVDLEVVEEVEISAGESEIKHLPKRGSQRRMRKK